MLCSDIFVIVTNIQFEKREGWQRRHKVQGKDKDYWLTVPVLGSQNQKIKDVQINNTFDWRRKNSKTLKFLYLKKTNDEEMLKNILSVYERSWQRLVDLNMEFINLLKEVLGISTEVVLDEEVTGIKQELLINICKKYEATSYLTGMGAKAYMDESYLADVRKLGIAINFVKRNLTPEYPYSTINYLLSFGRESVIESLGHVRQ